MTENKRFKLDDFDSDVEMWELLNIQAEIISDLENENEQLKAQLYCDSDEGVCTICKHHYLEKGKTYEKYYISKCKKGHEKSSKIDLKYCDDFELKKVVE